jgi:hypothetical protein
MSEEGKEVEVEGAVEAEGEGDEDDAADLIPLGLRCDCASILPPIAAPALALAPERGGGVDEDDFLSLFERQKSSPDV